MLIVALAACTPTADPAESAPQDTGSWGDAALAFLSERLVGSFQGEWQLYGLDETDTQVESYAWTDVITGSDPRIEDDRALVDIRDEMDGGTWTATERFVEGVYVPEEGGIGDYFYEIDDAITILTEVEPDRWEYTAEITDSDLRLMENVDESNFVDGWKAATKFVTWPDGWERHDVSVLTHVEYVDGSGSTVTAEYTSIVGYHHKFE